MDQILNIDNNSMVLIEGITNQEIQDTCEIIKNDMIDNIGIDESQFIFSCRLSDDEKEYIIDTKPHSTEPVVSKFGIKYILFLIIIFI